MNDATLTRRAFVGGCVLGAGTAAVMSLPFLPAAAGAATRPPLRHQVVSIHRDQPYLDRSGTAAPYEPACGAASEMWQQPVTLDDLRMRHCYL